MSDNNTQNKFIKSSFYVIIFIIIGKILAIIRDSLVGAKFGATYVTDMYTFAIGIVYLLTTISYGLTTTFIPINSELIEKNTKSERSKFVSNVINVYTLATIILTILLIVFAKYIVYVFGYGFTHDPVIYKSSVTVVRIMLLSLIFISIQSVVTGVLESHNEFYEPAAMAAVSNIVYIIYLVFFTSKYGIKGFAAAIVIGFFAQLMINVPKFRSLGYRYVPYFNFKDEKLKRMFKLMIPVIISTSIVQLNLFINKSFATNTYSGGATVLDFSNKISTMAYEVFAIGISMVIYPSLSSYASQGKSKEYKNTLIKGINMILLIMVPASLAIGILRMPLITIIFKRGAFDENAALKTSSALLFYCPAMIAYGVRDILNKAFYAVKDTKTPMINSFIGIIINIILNIILVGNMKISGLTLATTISATVTTVFMLIDLNTKMEKIGIGRMLRALFKIIVSSFIMAAAVFFINKFCMLKIGYNIKGSLVSIIFSFAAGISVYGICLYILKSDEFMYFVDMVKAKFKKVKSE